MRIPVLQLLIGGASFVIAIPLKVVVDGPIRPAGAVRVGLAGAGRVHAAAPDVYAETIDFSKVVITSEPFSGASEVSKPHCGGAKAKLEAMKNKIHEITHEFTDHIKEFFGFDVVEDSAAVVEHEDEPVIEEGEIHILPLMPGPVGPMKPSSIPKPFPPHLDADTFVENQNRNRMWMHRGRPTTLAGRIHKALHSLSPWEGRALSFVVGCGIGVLLRMLWVFTVLTFRFFSVKQRSIPTTETLAAATEDDAERERFLAPPEYEYDEKADH